MNISDGFYNSDSQNKKAHTLTPTKLGSDALKLIAYGHFNYFGVANKELILSGLTFEHSCLDLERKKGGAGWEKADQDQVLQHGPRQASSEISSTVFNGERSQVRG